MASSSSSPAGKSNFLRSREAQWWRWRWGHGDRRLLVFAIIIRVNKSVIHCGRPLVGGGFP